LRSSTNVQSITDGGFLFSVEEIGFFLLGKLCKVVFNVTFEVKVLISFEEA
jgi:hypothetical protein